MKVRVHGDRPRYSSAIPAGHEEFKSFVRANSAFRRRPRSFPAVLPGPIGPRNKARQRAYREEIRWPGFVTSRWRRATPLLWRHHEVTGVNQDFSLESIGGK